VHRSVQDSKGFVCNKVAHENSVDENNGLGRGIPWVAILDGRSSLPDSRHGDSPPDNSAANV
jgi:hypothetical protein